MARKRSAFYTVSKRIFDIVFSVLVLVVTCFGPVYAAALSQAVCLAQGASVFDGCCTGAVARLRGSTMHMPHCLAVVRSTRNTCCDGAACTNGLVVGVMVLLLAAARAQAAYYFT